MKTLVMSLVIAVAGLSNTALAGNAAQQRFAYNTEETGNAEIQYVYKVSADGQYLSHHLKYRCTYDGHRRLLMKEILRWDDASAKYCPVYYGLTYQAYEYDAECDAWQLTGEHEVDAALLAGR